MQNSEIFFFISSVGFIILALLMAVLLIYIISILKNVQKISKTAKEGTEAIVESINEAKNSIQEDGMVSFFTKLFKKLNKKRK